MHDIKWIRENPTAFDKALDSRNYDGKRSQELIQIGDELRNITTRLQAVQERRNAASKEVGIAKKNKDDTRADELMAEVAALKAELQEGENKSRKLAEKLKNALAEIPNLPAADVPPGNDEHDNVEKSRFISKERAYTLLQEDVDGRVKPDHDAQRDEHNPWAGFTPRQHFDIGEAFGEMDFDTAAKISGARFVVMKGQLARLERALGQFMLDTHTQEHGYLEVNPPVLVRDEAMFGTAQLPKFEDDQFFASNSSYIKNVILSYDKTNSEASIHQKDSEFSQIKISNQENLDSAILKSNRHWLIPTAEVPLTNLVRESILDDKQLPLRFTALTPCFRAEAGAAGRDTRGLIRQHQFSKVEMVSITTPEQSQAEHERMLECAENILKKLDLSYRVVTLCTGDMGFAAQKTYDIEVWLPGQGAYREISSCSSCGEFQARRMDARFRHTGEKGTRFVHTLNGSGLAVGRTLVAVLETYQNPDGSVTVPDVLRPYMGGLMRIGG
jgi:seryl-tRNA synthetase